MKGFQSVPSLEIPPTSIGGKIDQLAMKAEAEEPEEEDIEDRSCSGFDEDYAESPPVMVGNASLNLMLADQQEQLRQLAVNLTAGTFGAAGAPLGFNPYSLREFLLCSNKK